MIGVWLHRFFEDTRTQVALLLVVLDVILGVLAAVQAGGFRLSFVADFMRNDVLGKVVPFFVLYGGFVYAKNADLVIPGVDLEVLMNASWVVVLAALGGSLLNSLKDLGLLKGLTNQIAGPDPESPTPPPSDA